MSCRRRPGDAAGSPALPARRAQHLPTSYSGDAPFKGCVVSAVRAFRLMLGGGFPRSWTLVPQWGNIKVLLRTLAAASRGYRGSGTGPEFSLRAGAGKAQRSRKGQEPAGVIFSHRDPSRRTGYPYLNFVTD